MPGTKIGAMKAVKTTKLRHGESFYKTIGRKGGEKLGTTGGFASNIVGEDGLTGRERCHKVGAVGGRKSKRGHTFVKDGWFSSFYINNKTGQMVKFPRVKLWKS